jgi:FHA domain-containing protein/double zinc ribbon protein
MTTLTCPTCSATVGREDLICFTCGANLPVRGPVDDDTAPATVMQEYRREGSSASPEAPATCPACGAVIADRSVTTCPTCGKPVVVTGPISAVVLRLSFPTGNVDVPAGTSLVLGRDPAESLVAAAFAPYENVSRRHATVMVSDGGEATIRDEHSTNGTFVNGDRVVPGTDVRLGDGDSVRLAADVTAAVSLPGKGPDAAGTGQGGAGFSQNGQSAHPNGTSSQH